MYWHDKCNISIDIQGTTTFCRTCYNFFKLHNSQYIPIIF